MAELLFTFVNPTRERDMERSCRVLEEGGVIAYPTEVGWAIGCDAANPKAIDQIRLLKPHHPKEQPFSLLCSTITMVSEYCLVGNDAYSYLKKAWPGPYTVILPRTKTVARQLKDKRSVVGVRIPRHDLILAVIQKWERPIATTSVPMVDEQYLRYGYEIEEHFGHGIDLILDLGEEVLGGESTIIDMSEGAPRLVRLGLGDPLKFGISPGSEDEF